ncbi:hypothetical protein ACVU7I_12470 [Patulibacter sp. S7RM1-6]
MHGGGTSSAAYDDIRRRIVARIAELEPLLEEHARLRAVLDAVDETLDDGHRPAREHVPRLTAIVAARPGIRQSDAAREIGVERTAVYAVVRRAVARGLVAKRDGALYPVDGAANGAVDGRGDSRRLSPAPRA